MTRLTPLLLLVLFVVVNALNCSSGPSAASDDPAVRARQARLQRNFARAASEYIEAILRDPSRPELFLSLAECQYELGWTQDAIDSCGEALKRNPEFWEAQLYLFKLQLVAADWSDPERARVKGDLDAMLKAREEAGRLDQKFLLFLNETHAMIAKDDSADPAFDIKKYSAVLSQEDRDRTVVEEAFWKARQTQPQEKMIEEFEKFVTQYPATPQWTEYAYNWIFKWYGDSKTLNLDKLRSHGEKWVHDMPGEHVSYYMVSRAYSDHGMDYVNAIGYAKKAIELFESPAIKEEWHAAKNDPEVMNYEKTLAAYTENLGWAYVATEDMAKGRQFLNKAMDISSEVPNTHYHLGLVEEREGNIDRAISCFVTALTMTNHPEAEKALQRVEGTQFTNRAQLRHKYYADRTGSAHALFTDVTASAGFIDADKNPIKCGGVAWGDYDHDGFEDLLIDGRTLYRNQGDGTFKNVSDQAKLNGPSGSGVWADYNNDGNLDFFTVVQAENDHDRLWKNNSDGTFTDVTKEAGITDTLSPESPDKCAPGQAAGWADVDRDGFVDLYVANYERTGNPLRRGTTDKLFHNNGDGTFTDVLSKVGMAVPVPRCGRGVAWGDFNNDGEPDLYVSNYRLDPNFLFVNRNGRFINQSSAYGVEGKESWSTEDVEAVSYFAHSIGAAWGDFDNDGDLDLFCANLAHPRAIQYSQKSVLYINDYPRKSFTEIRIPSGIKYEETHSQPAWADFDNDGNLDLFITSIYEGRYAFLYRNRGNRTFEDVTWLAGVRAENGWGCAWADTDNDGDLDLVVASGSGMRLYRNDGNDAHWLHVRLEGTHCNRSAIGARVSLVNRTVFGVPYNPIREVEGGAGTASQNSLEVEFGLGGQADSVNVEIRWPCGKTQLLQNVSTNQILTVTEPK